MDRDGVGIGRIVTGWGRDGEIVMGMGRDGDKYTVFQKLPLDV